MSSNAENGAKKDYRNPGLRTVQTTSLFRVVNFELFVKPNKYVMAIGLTAISLSAGYLFYMNTNYDKETYVAVSEDGDRTLRTKTSKWD